MKKFVVRLSLPAFLLVLFLIAGASISYAQVPVSVSKEKVRVNGTLMYAHQVTKGQTVYSICKAYNVTPEELQKANPSLSGGLKDGMLLVIPIKEVSEEVQKKEEKGAWEKTKEGAAYVGEKAKEGAVYIGEKAKEGAVYVADKAKDAWKETKDFIVGTPDDKKKEPAAQEKKEERIAEEKTEKPAVKEGPVDKKEPEVKKEEPAVKPAVKEEVKEVAAKVSEGDTFIEHKVKWYEDLDEISNEYKLDKEIIKYYNGLTSESLDKVPSLKIPTGATLERVKKEYVNTIHKKMPNNTLPQVFIEETPAAEDSLYNALQLEEREIAVILPLYSHNKLSATYMDFYSGALLAAQELNEAGNGTDYQRGTYKFKFIDQSKYQSAESLIKLNHLEKADLIIGPIRSSDINNYIDFINEHQIPMVSPLDPSADSLTAKSPYLFQVPVSSQLQDIALAGMLNQFSEMSRNNSITVIYEEGSADALQAGKIMDILNENNIPYTVISFPISKAVEIGGTFKKKFNPLYNNLAVVLSNNEGFVAEALRNLSILSMPQDNITVIGTSKWRNFDALDLNLFFQFNLHLICPYYVDLSRESVQRFVQQYREAYGAEPSGNAFSGYDMVTTFAPNISQMKAAAQENNTLFKAAGLQQSILMMNNKNYGITGVIYHSNYTVSSTPLRCSF